ncbi:MAG: ATP-binding protein [bacterium]|nr:ATP-binding protein [bacterium]
MKKKIEKPEICPKCNGAGWEVVKEDDVEAVKRCSCFYSRISERLLIESRIPKRYQHCDFESFYELTSSLGQAKKIASDFVREYPVVQAGLIFIGQPGAGKTHLAVAIIKELIKQKCIPCAFYDFRDLLKEIQNSYNAQAQTSELEVLKPIFQKEVIVLDELGASKITNWVQDTLSYIINQRYNDKKITIFTSNYLDEPAVKTDETLENRIGTRLRSRLYEMCHVVEINAKDFRKEMKHSSIMSMEKQKEEKRKNQK